MKKLALSINLLVFFLLFICPVASADVYFSHVACTGMWDTEICAINTSTETITGTFEAFDNSGNSVSNNISVTLAANARREINVGTEFSVSSDIGYIIFVSDSKNIVGYTKFYINGQYRVAVPAISNVTVGDLYISHIASTDKWWTGISIVNTTSTSKDLTIEFDNATTKTVSLAGKEHKAFSIKSLFGNISQPLLNSAVIKNASGVVGLELFGSTSQLSGILLKNDTAKDMYYPHIASSDKWWTGIVAYNPSSSACTLTVRPYTAEGISLATQSVSITGKGKYIGTIQSLGLPADSAWFQIESTTAITGFELFGTNDNTILAGYTGVNISSKEGIFAKTDKNGWTGIALVNVGTSLAIITLTAYDDSGNEIDTELLILFDHEKIVDTPEHIFIGDISNATYITYSSDEPLVGFQLNGSSDDMMLDGLPALFVNDGNNSANGTGTEIDMWSGGVATSADGVSVEVLEGSWMGTVEVVFEEPQTNNDPVEDGYAVSDIYVIRLDGFEAGETTVPFKVTTPVTTTGLPTPIDEYAFAIETYNEDTGEWERDDAMAQYDESCECVTFWTNHFSKKRVVYIGDDPNVALQKYLYKSDNNRFYITYFVPVTFNKPSDHLPLSDIEWSGSGTAIDPEVPDYIEDLGKALETALTYHTTKIIQPDGYLLFDDPTHDVVSLPDHAISVTVKKIPAKGDTRLGGPVRINSRLKDWHEMKVVAAHELVHILGSQHYTGTSARLNRWFYEAIAEFYGTRAAGYTKDEYTTYFSNYYNYLRVSLDASDEKSYYAIGDFLYWLEDEMNGQVAAGVVASNYVWDVSGLNNLLSDWGSSLGDEYTRYVLECTMGDHDYRADNIKKSIVLNTSLFNQLKFKQPHLSATHVRINPYASKDGMLVAESGVHYQYGGGIPLKTYSYTDATIPVADIDNNLEKTTETNKPIVVKHFGKKGTDKVEHSVFHQIIINPLIGDVVAGGGEYYFDYYILVPPEIEDTSDGKVTWSFPGYGEGTSSIKGFNVYSDGVLLTNTPATVYLQEYSDARIRSTSDVQVTVVDQFDNEWPEVEEEKQPPNWEMSIYINNATADTDNYYPALVDDWHTDIWIPLTVSPDGSVTVDHRFANPLGINPDVKTHHIWGTGTYKNEKLMISGQWASDNRWTHNAGAYDEYTRVHKVNGEFTLVGHFIGGFFFSDADESHATANATHVTTWADPEYSAPRSYNGPNLTPKMTVEDFRPIQ